MEPLCSNKSCTRESFPGYKQCGYCINRARAYKVMRMRSVRGRSCTRCTARIPPKGTYRFKRCEECRAKARKPPESEIKRKCIRCPVIFTGSTKTCPSCLKKRMRAKNDRIIGTLLPACGNCGRTKYMHGSYSTCYRCHVPNYKDIID